MAESVFEPSPLAPRRTPEEQARDRDLGFGSVVSRQSRQRLLNRDGSFNVVRTGLGFLDSLAPYHQLLTISWGGFLGVASLLYLILNLAFAAAFMACGSDALLGPGSAMLGGRFSRAFFFSIQTFATIGYGQVGPNGLAANLVVTVEAPRVCSLRGSPGRRHRCCSAATPSSGRTTTVKGLKEARV
jgi:inward rectifier potassium channel